MTRAADTDLAVAATGLVKTFDDFRAVDGIDLEVRRGEVFGVLGPNGAGKTTTLKMLATLLPMDGGEASIFGVDVRRNPHMIRQLVGVTGQYASVDENLTGAENLWLFGRLQGLSSSRSKATATDLLERFGLTEARDKQIKTFSGGMRRRLDLAASLISQPPLLFLDEPTTGLDPRSRNHVWEIVRGLVAEGTTVLLTTQYLDEADQLADRIAIIDDGRVIAEGTSGELKALVGAGSLHVRLAVAEQRPQAERILTEVLGEPATVAADPAALVVCAPEAERAADALAALSRAGVVVAEFALGQPSLDEVFLQLTGHPAEQAAPAEEVA